MMTEKENAVAVEGEGGGRDGEEEFDKNKRKRPDESTPKDHHQHKEEQTNDDRASSTSSPPPVIIAITIPRPEEEFSSELPKPESGALQRSDSYHEVCRVCHQQTEESLVELGCRCRGDLSKAHQTCINIWFHSRGSNKCEICWQIATNIPSPDSLPRPNYWVWRVGQPRSDSTVERIQPIRGRFSPLWIVVIFLICGLLLDVLISLSLGFSSLPIDIIIGVLIVLGLGTAFRLLIECFNETNFRTLQTPDATLGAGYTPTL